MLALKAPKDHQESLVPPVLRARKVLKAALARRATPGPLARKASRGLLVRKASAGPLARKVFLAR